MKKNLRKILSISLLSLLLSSCGGSSGYQIEEVDNAGGSSFYEIFVGSFCDSNNDGIGDLKGVESKLDYLKKLGISNIWLTPIHPSPSYHKYDVKDYYSIDPNFGTMADFESLVSTAKTKGIGVIMDMVFNHCSNQNPWFTSWCQAMKDNDSSSEVFEDFSWSRRPKDGYGSYPDAGGVYVECNFDYGMPEFNLDSPHVRAELKKIQDFWLDKGVAGFRYDAVVYYYCINGGGVISGLIDQNVEVMRYLADSAKAKKSDAYLVGEAWIEDPSTLAGYAASTMNVFNFAAAGLTLTGSAGKALNINGGPAFAEALVNTQKLLREANPNGDTCFFVANHDMDRWGGYRSGHYKDVEGRRAVASLYLLTPGTPFLYYGEEIEMLGTRDPNSSTDALRRQAMVWGGGEHQCNQPEGRSAPEQVTKGVKESLDDGRSTLNHYRKVLSIRNKYKDLFRKGTYEVLDLDSKYACGFKITLGQDTYYLVHNCYDEPLELKISGPGAIVETIDTNAEAATYKDGTLKLPLYTSVLMR